MGVVRAAKKPSSSTTCGEGERGRSWGVKGTGLNGGYTSTSALSVCSTAILSALLATDEFAYSASRARASVGFPFLTCATVPFWNGRGGEVSWDIACEVRRGLLTRRTVGRPSTSSTCIPGVSLASCAAAESRLGLLERPGLNVPEQWRIDDLWAAATDDDGWRRCM